MKRNQQPRIVLPRLVVFLLVGSLYIAACACPAVKLVDVERAHDFGEINIFPDQEKGSHIGFAALVFGWDPPWVYPWSANLLLLVGGILLLLNRNKLAAGFGATAALAGLSTWLLFSVAHDLHRLDQLLVGYYLWQASLTAFALGTVAIWLWEPQGRLVDDSQLSPDSGEGKDAGRSVK